MADESAAQPGYSLGGRGINPGSWVRRASEAAEGEGEEEEIPEEWGWPKEAYLPADLQAFVKEALEAAGGASSELPAPDPRALEKGRWYRFPGAEGSGHVFAHNYTRDMTTQRPANCIELTEMEKAKLGVPIADLPMLLRRIYSTKKVIPAVFGTEAACHAMRQFATYGADTHLLDTSVLRRVNERSLEECRVAIVSAMRYGKALCVFIGDNVCDFEEKVCIPKNKGKFPVGLFRHGCLEGSVVKDQIYTQDDREGGQCVVREGFIVYLLISYGDGGGAMEINSARRDDLRRIPYFDITEEVRCHCDEDRTTLLQEALRNQ